jgi:hypothetical protein
MRKRTGWIIQFAGAVLLALAITVTNGAYAQKKKATALKIGTYDSRIVAMAWSRSEHFMDRLKKINQQSDSATKTHDSALLKVVSVGAMSYQHLLHQAVFSNGSIAFIMGQVKDSLPDLARSAGVTAILSKWELTFCDPSVEVIDLSDQVAQLFHPKQNIDKIVSDIRKQDPMPLPDMSIETEMLDGYCARFGKK